MASVALVGVSKAYAAVGAVDAVSVAVESGRFLTLLGPSGCGKSTTLRLIAGLVAPDRGEILIDGEDVTAVPTHQRRIGMVFQNLALFPHMSVARNVEFGLRMRQVDRHDRTRRVAEALAMVKLTGLEDRLPKQLSGGQQQRVALARALVTRPRVLLLDEPFAALDRKLRLEMQGELRELTRRTGTTAVFVTHDQEEALVLSDGIAVMNHGRIEQMGAPSAVFDRPANAFVADFMGATNLFAGRVEARNGDQARIALDGGRLTVLASSAAAVGEAVSVAIRPEAIALGPPGTAEPANSIDGVVESVVYQGTHATYRVRAGAAAEFRLIARVSLSDKALATGFLEGDRVRAAWGAFAVHVMPR
jgi:spermidine/putrescine ABC transporter ATP-binding subunit